MIIIRIQNDLSPGDIQIYPPILKDQFKFKKYVLQNNGVHVRVLIICYLN